MMKSITKTGLDIKVMIYVEAEPALGKPGKNKRKSRFQESKGRYLQLFLFTIWKFRPWEVKDIKKSENH